MSAAPFLSPGGLGRIELNDGRQENIAWIGCAGSLSHLLSDYLCVRLLILSALKRLRWELIEEMDTLLYGVGTY